MRVEWTVGGAGALSSIQEDKQILKFMDWCLFLTDNKLCHVVFVRNTTSSYTTQHKLSLLRRCHACECLSALIG